MTLPATRKTLPTTQTPQDKKIIKKQKGEPLFFYSTDKYGPNIKHFVETHGQELREQFAHELDYLAEIVGLNKNIFSELKARLGVNENELTPNDPFKYLSDSELFIIFNTTKEALDKLVNCTKQANIQKDLLKKVIDNLSKESGPCFYMTAKALTDSLHYLIAGDLILTDEKKRIFKIANNTLFSDYNNLLNLIQKI